MKRNTMKLGLACLAIAFQWGCEKEPVTPTDAEINFRGHKPNQNQGSGNNLGMEVYNKFAHAGE